MKVLEMWVLNSPDGRKPVTANVEREDEMFVEIERVWNGLDQGMILPSGARLLAPVRAVSGVPAWHCQGKTLSRFVSSHIQVPRPQDFGCHGH
jgi:hypothetical protein